MDPNSALVGVLAVLGAVGAKRAREEIVTPYRNVSPSDPVFAGDLIAWLGPQASELQVRSGIPASVTVAQAIQESGWKLSTLAKKARNLFGVKASPGWRGEVYSGSTHEYFSGVRVEVAGTGKIYPSYSAALADGAHVQSLFRVYPTYRAALDDRGGMFYRVSAYHPALAYRSNWREFVKRIAPVYATDPNYATALINLVESHRLYKFDVPPISWALDPKIVPELHIATWRNAIGGAA